MNEIEIIRAQVSAEQSHAAQVAHACAAVFGSKGAAPGPGESAALFREACVSYLVWVLARFEERDQTLSELLASRQSAAGGTAPGIAAGAGAGAAAGAAAQLGALIGRSGTSREALSRLETALAADGAEAARSAWQEFARFFQSAWLPRRAALEGALAAHLSVAEWRAVCAIDADSILDERRRYERVMAQLPADMAAQPSP